MSELRKLEASEGMTLTNGEAYGKEIYLGIYDSPENWTEITDAEAERRQAVFDEDTPTAAEYEAALSRLGVEK